MTTTGKNSLNTRQNITISDKTYDYFSLKEAEKHIGDVSKLPFSLKVLLENLLRFQDDRSVSQEDIQAVADWLKEKKSTKEISLDTSF